MGEIVDLFYHVLGILIVIIRPSWVMGKYTPSNAHKFVQVGKVVHSALPARLLVDDTRVYILMNCEGVTSDSTPIVVANVPLVAVALVDSPNQFRNTPRPEVAVMACHVRRSVKKKV